MASHVIPFCLPRYSDSICCLVGHVGDIQLSSAEGSTSYAWIFSSLLNQMVLLVSGQMMVSIQVSVESDGLTLMPSTPG